MKFMIMHKMTEEMEQGLPPDPATMAQIGELVGEATQRGVFHGGEGLRPSSQRVHLDYRGGARKVTRGPFTEAKELLAGFAMLRVSSAEEALVWAEKLAAALGETELFLGPVVEPWDLGFAPCPQSPPLRFLCMPQASDRTEGDAALDPEREARVQAIFDEMTRAGVLLTRGDLASTKRGARVRLAGGKATVIDGPFTESKELIAGYAIFELPSKAEAIDWAIRFAKIVKVREIDVRELC
ncbi:MAG: YciI family protein [Kofleriaceae bacterium]